MTSFGSFLRKRPGYIVAVVSSVVCLAYVLTIHYPTGFLIGDAACYALVAVSVVEDHDLRLDGPRDRQFERWLRIKTDGPDYALGIRGEVYPKHPLVMPLLSIPFYLLSGLNGLLVFNLIVIQCVVVLAYVLSREFAGKGAALLSGLLLPFGSMLLDYSYNYSPDAFSTLLVLAGTICLFRMRPAATGFFLGMAVWQKPPNAIFFAMALLSMALFPDSRPAGRGLVSWASRCMAGSAAPLLVMCLFNWHLFGSPLSNGYLRTLAGTAEEGKYWSHAALFTYPLARGVWGQLMDHRLGLLFTCPISIFFLPGFVWALSRRFDWRILFLLVCGVGQFLLFAKLDGWYNSLYSNRYLMTLVCYSAAAFAILAENLVVPDRAKSVLRERGSDR